MNKALMKVATPAVLDTLGEAAIGQVIENLVPDHVVKEVKRKTGERAMMLGVLRWHGLLPDEWIMASIARQWKFAVRDGHAPNDPSSLKLVQEKAAMIMDAACQAYEREMKKYGVDLGKQPKFGSDVAKETHELLEKIANGSGNEQRP